MCGGGGGGCPPPPTVERLLKLCVSKWPLIFWHIKRLIIRPPFFHFCLVSPINGGGGGGLGSCTSLSYASDSGVTRICQREAK